MRDENRIPEVMDALEEYWEEHPDLRLAQIVGNIAQENGYGKDPYYMEDDELLRELKNMNE